MDPYDKNIIALKNLNPAYAQWLLSRRSNGSVEKLKAAQSGHNLRINLGSGQSFLLYPSENPEQTEAERDKGLHLPAGQSTVLFGLGLAYRAQGLLSRMKSGHYLFIVEENPEVVKAALSEVDLTGRIINQQAVFTLPQEDFLDRLARTVAPLYARGEADIIVDDHCRRYFSPEFKSQIDRFQRTVHRESFRAEAFRQHVPKLVENEIINIPLTLLSAGISGLKGVLQGAPAVVVSAGPSLTASLRPLGRVAGRAAILATAPVLRVMLAAGLMPDLACILDYTPSNYHVLQDVYNTEDVPLVFLEGVYPRVIRDYQGDLISILDADGPVKKWLGPQLKNQDPWPVGDNVGSFCLDLAVYLGADPIILVGQDLAFPELMIHGEGIIGVQTLDSQHLQPHQVMVESTAGGRVASNITFAAYLETFNETISQNPETTFINTSPNGARITGTMEMPLDEALDRYCREEKNITRRIRQVFALPPEDLSGVWDELTGLDQELAHLKVVTAKALEFNKDILDILERASGPQDEDLAGLAGVHAEYVAGAEKYWQAFAPLKNFLTPSLSPLSGPGDPAAHDRDWREKYKLDLEQQRRIMAAARDGAVRLRDLLKIARTELEDIVAVRDLRRSPDPSAADDKRVARAWSRLGRYKEAWSSLRTALIKGHDDVELVLEAAGLSLKRERARAACDLVKLVADGRQEWKKSGGFLHRVEETAASWLTQARESLDREDWVTALLAVGKFLAFDPQSPAAREIKDSALSLRDRSLTRAEKKASLQWQRNLVRKLVAHAERAFEQGRHDEVVELLSGRLDPEVEDDHQGLALLGASLADQGRKEEGLKILRRLQALRPGCGYVSARLGAVLLKNGQIEAGLNLLEQAGRTDRNFSGYLFEAGCLRMQSGDYQQAICNFLEHSTAHPASYETLNKLAICHLAQGRPQYAERYFKKSLTLQPESETARLGLEKCRQTTGRMPERKEG